MGKQEVSPRLTLVCVSPSSISPGRSLSIAVVCGLNLSVSRRAGRDIITDFPKRIESKQKKILDYVISHVAGDIIC